MRQAANLHIWRHQRENLLNFSFFILGKNEKGQVWKIQNTLRFQPAFMSISANFHTQDISIISEMFTLWNYFGLYLAFSLVQNSFPFPLGIRMCADNEACLLKPQVKVCISENYVNVLQFEYSSAKTCFAYAKLISPLKNHWILIKLHFSILSWIWTMKLSCKALYPALNPRPHPVQSILSCQSMEFCNGIRKLHDNLYSQTKFGIQMPSRGCITQLHAALA